IAGAPSNEAYSGAWHPKRDQSRRSANRIIMRSDVQKLMFLSRLSPVFFLFFVLRLLGPVELPAQGFPMINPEKAWAFVIGIANYEHAEPLKYAALDASAMADFLRSPRGGGFLPDHVDELLEGEATRDAILTKLGGPNGLIKKVKESDRVYVFIAGH